MHMPLRARRRVRGTGHGLRPLLEWIVLLVCVLSITWVLIYLMQVGGEADMIGRGGVAAPGGL
jgi:hypothetical protein